MSQDSSLAAAFRAAGDGRLYTAAQVLPRLRDASSYSLPVQQPVVADFMATFFPGEPSVLPSTLLGSKTDLYREFLLDVERIVRAFPWFRRFFAPTVCDVVAPLPTVPRATLIEFAKAASRITADWCYPYTGHLGPGIACLEDRRPPRELPASVFTHIRDGADSLRNLGLPYSWWNKRPSLTSMLRGHAFEATRLAKASVPVVRSTLGQVSALVTTGRDEVALRVLAYKGVPMGVARVMIGALRGLDFCTRTPVRLFFSLSACGLVYAVYHGYFRPWFFDLLTGCPTRTLLKGQGGTPFCFDCTPQAVDFEVGPVEFEKKFLLPNRCSRCSWFPSRHGYKAAKIGIPASMMSTLATYRSYCHVKEARDVASPFSNICDVGDGFKTVMAFLQEHAGTLASMEDRRSMRRSEHTRSYCYSTPWMEKAIADKPAADGASTATPPSGTPAEVPAAKGPKAKPPTDGKKADSSGAAHTSGAASSSGLTPEQRAAAQADAKLLGLHAAATAAAASAAEAARQIAILATKKPPIPTGAPPFAAEPFESTQPLDVPVAPSPVGLVKAAPAPDPPTQEVSHDPEPEKLTEDVDTVGKDLPIGEGAAAASEQQHEPLDQPLGSPSGPPVALGPRSEPDPSPLPAEAAPAVEAEAPPRPPPPPTPPPPPPHSPVPPGKWFSAQHHDFSFSGITQLRAYWNDTVAHQGLLPQTSLLEVDRERINHYMGRKKDGTVLKEDCSAASRAVLAGVEKPSGNYLSPPPGMIAGVAYTAQAMACGIPMTAPTIHCTSDKMHGASGAEKRLDVSVRIQAVKPMNGVDPDSTIGPGDKPKTVKYAFDETSPTAVRYAKFWSAAFASCYTKERVLRAFNELFGTKELWELHMSAFSEAERVRARELLLTKDPTKFHPRKANGKLELVEKDGKPVRFVIDNGLELLMMGKVITKVFEYLLYSESMGVFYSMSIKGRPRDKVLDAFAKRHSRQIRNRTGLDRYMAAFEIDQTGMEKHERLNKLGYGLMAPIYKILHFICNTVQDKMCGHMARLYSAKLNWDKENGMRVKVQFKGDHLVKAKTVTLSFEDLYLDSGWSLTSGHNFAVELAATYSCMVMNPQHLFAWDDRKMDFRLRQGTFNWCFESVKLWIPETSEDLKAGRLSKADGKLTTQASQSVEVEATFEGDDGGGQADRLYAVPENRAIVVGNMEELGLDSKIKTIINGRLEIIGAHFSVVNGAVDPSIPWCPAVMRCVGKLGAVVGTALSPESMAARFLSLACAYSGRNEVLHDAFWNSASRVIGIMSRTDKDCMQREVKVTEWSSAGRWLLDGVDHSTTVTLQKLLDLSLVRHCRPPYDFKTQLKMVNNSVGESVTANVISVAEWSKMSVFADEMINPDLGIELHAEALYSFLPKAMQRKGAREVALRAA